MTKTKLFVILVISLVIFAFIVPIVPTSTSIMIATGLRDECGGGFSSTQPPVTVYTSMSYSMFDNYGSVFLPKGTPYPSDNNSLYFEPFGPNYPLDCG